MSGLLWLAGALLLYALAALATAFFAGTETGMISLNKPRLRHQAEAGNRRAQRILHWSQRQDTFIATTLIGTNLAVVTATAVMTAIGIRYLGPYRGSLAATVVSTAIIIIVSEVIPKAVFRQYANRLMLELSGLFHLSVVALLLPSYLFSFIARMIFRLLNVPPPPPKSGVGKDELRIILQTGQEEGEFTAEEHAMITQVFDMGKTRTREVMIPLIDVEMLNETATVDEFLALARRTGYSRFPVYRGRVDEVVGVLAVYDVLFAAEPTPTVAGMMRPPHFVPETKPADELLRDMQKQRLAAKVVIDEFGGAVGFVTMEQILEQIVGEIHDEGDDIEIWYRQISDGVWVVDGGADIDELGKVLGITLPKDGYDTLAGLVLFALGRVPRAGEKLVRSGYRLTVLSMDGPAVERVKVEKIPEAPAETAGT